VKGFNFVVGIPNQASVPLQLPAYLIAFPYTLAGFLLYMCTYVVYFIWSLLKRSSLARARLARKNWCCFYRPRRGVSHTRIGYALSLICMFLIWLATLSQYLTEPHYHAQARQCLCKKLYCICTHWLFVQSYAWWPAVVSATQQRHMWLPTTKPLSVSRAWDNPKYKDF
jgi:hypothetical protein